LSIGRVGGLEIVGELEIEETMESLDEVDDPWIMYPGIISR
jgi:hypothetical protein